MKDLLIFPFNGNALEALDCLGGKFNLIGFIDDTSSKQGLHHLGFEVFSRDALLKYPKAQILAVPGSPTSFSIRHEIIAGLKIGPERFATVIHNHASVSPLAKIGYNVLLMAGVVITSNAFIDNHVCILPNSVVHHDSEVGEYTLLGSNITVAGNTSIGKSCYLGSGTSVINGISIGDHSIVGMGTNVIKSIPPKSKVVGNPGRSI